MEAASLLSGTMCVAVVCLDPAIWAGLHRKQEHPKPTCSSSVLLVLTMMESVSP